MEFLGTYEHSIDDRGRIAIPTRYREALAEGVVCARSPEGCIEVYARADYERKARALRRQPDTRMRNRRLRRVFFGNSWDGELDRQGRLLLPLALRQWAETNGTVTIVGRGECLEIWDSARLAGEMTAAEQEYGEDLESSEWEIEE